MRLLIVLLLVGQSLLAQDYGGETDRPSHLWARLGLERNAAFYDIYPTVSGNGIPMGTAILPRIGIGIEYLMPRTRDRYSLYVAADYRLHHTYTYRTPRTGNALQRLEYGAINFPLGVRRYIRLGDSNELTLTAGGVMDIPLGRGLYRADGGGKTIVTDANFGFEAGLGLELGARYRAEARHQFKRNISPGYSRSTMPYRATYLTLSYRLR